MFTTPNQMIPNLQQTTDAVQDSLSQIFEPYAAVGLRSTDAQPVIVTSWETEEERQDIKRLLQAAIDTIDDQENQRN